MFFTRRCGVILHLFHCLLVSRCPLVALGICQGSQVRELGILQSSAATELVQHRCQKSLWAESPGERRTGDACNGQQNYVCENLWHAGVRDQHARKHRDEVADPAEALRKVFASLEHRSLLKVQQGGPAHKRERAKSEGVTRR